MGWVLGAGVRLLPDAVPRFEFWLHAQSHLSAKVHSGRQELVAWMVETHAVDLTCWLLVLAWSNPGPQVSSQSLCQPHTRLASQMHAQGPAHPRLWWRPLVLNVRSLSMCLGPRWVTLYWVLGGERWDLGLG